MSKPSNEKGPTAARVARWIGWVALGAGLLMLGLALPLHALLERLRSVVLDLGALGPLAYGALYVVGALLMVPGSALTLMAGGLFDLWTAVLVVWVAATTAAALSFIVARHLAREPVRRRAARSRVFGAVDRAVAEGGWRVVALLRLSPAVPFNVQNYLYGVTGVRFVPCVVASAVAMLPGTFLYVYTVHLGVAAVAGEADGWTWALRILGLLATVAVTVYITRRARAELAARTELEAGMEREAPRGWTRRTTLLLVAGLLIGGLGATAWALQGRLGSMFGPAPAPLEEKYAGQAEGEVFDHGAWDALLKAHVQPGGWVDYAGFGRDAAKLGAYLDALAGADFAALSRDEKLALLMNAYNAFTIRLMLDHPTVESIRDIPGPERWDAVRWELAGETLSLNQIEHARVRTHFREPRIHFALVCAAIGCPPLRAEAFTGAKLEAQLAEQTRHVHTHGRWLQGPADGVVRLTRLYDWYRSDFEKVGGSVQAYVGRHAPAVKPEHRVEWLPYDWTLNDVKNRTAPRFDASP